MDLSQFEGLLGTLDLPKLRSYQLLINSAIQNVLSGNNSVSGGSYLSAKSNVRSVHDTIELHENFIDTTERELLMGELLSLGFTLKTKTKSDKVQNKFISSLPEPYSWPSKKGPVINHPLDMNSFGSIKSIMDQINQKFGCKMNSVLVSCYASGIVNTGLHKDDEKSLDPNQPICVLSIGAIRQVEWVAVDKPSKYAADLTINPADSSLYIMKAGCQDDFLHRVRRDKRVKSWRISLSFRCSVPEESVVADNVAVDSTSSSAPRTPPSAPRTPPAITQTHAAPSASTPNLANGPQGFSPFPNHSTLGSFNSQNERVCLILGSSITKNVSGELLSRRSRTVINLSESGANIFDLTKVVNEFYSENPCVVHKVDKIVINIGTNDIKWLNGRKVSVFKKFRVPMSNFIKDLKFLFPNALIIFTTVLPIRALYDYTAMTVNHFNHLLYQVCNEFGCIFYDCFLDFLAPDQRDYNSSLFRDKWHLNDNGLRLLCRSIKDCIYGKLFNSRAKSRSSSSFYNFY